MRFGICTGFGGCPSLSLVARTKRRILIGCFSVFSEEAAAQRRSFQGASFADVLGSVVQGKINMVSEAFLCARRVWHGCLCYREECSAVAGPGREIHCYGRAWQMNPLTLWAQQPGLHVWSVLAFHVASFIVRCRLCLCTRCCASNSLLISHVVFWSG